MSKLSAVRVMHEAFKEFVTQLDEFIEGPLPNGYVYGEDIISVYTRKAVHVIGNVVYNCLDVSSITVAESYRGQGLGIRVIDHMHKINPFHVTFVESLLNDGLRERLLKERWDEVPNSIPPSVYKFKPHKDGRYR